MRKTIATRNKSTYATHAKMACSCSMALDQLSLSLKQLTKWLQPNESLTMFKILKGMCCVLFMNFQ